MLWDLSKCLSLQAVMPLRQLTDLDWTLLGGFSDLEARLNRGQAELEEPQLGNAFGSTARDSGSSVCLNIRFQKSRGQV